MKLTLSMIDLENLWRAVTALLEFIKETRLKVFRMMKNGGSLIEVTGDDIFDSLALKRGRRQYHLLVESATDAVQCTTALDLLQITALQRTSRLREDRLWREGHQHRPVSAAHGDCGGMGSCDGGSVDRPYHRL